MATAVTSIDAALAASSTIDGVSPATCDLTRRARRLRCEEGHSRLPPDDAPGAKLVLRLALDVAPPVARPLHAPQHGDARPRGAVEQEEQRDADPEEEPRQRVEDEHAEHRERRDAVWVGLRWRAPARPAHVEAEEGVPARDVHGLDERRDDNGGQSRFGQLHEEPGEEEPRDDGQGSDDGDAELRARAGGRVRGSLRQAADDDEPARERRAEI